MANKQTAQRQQAEARQLRAIADAIRENTSAYERNAKKELKKPKGWLAKSVQVVGVGLGAVSVAVNIGLWLAALDTLQETRSQFVVAQRPIVWPYTVEQQQGTSITPGERIQWRIGFGNYGQGPALKIITMANLFHGPDAMADAEQFFREAAVRALNPPPDRTGSVLMPGVTGPPSGSFISPSSEDVLTPADVDFILNTSGGIVVVGRTDYEDIFGTTYFSEYCSRRLTSSAVQHCPTHNTVSEGQPRQEQD